MKIITVTLAPNQAVLTCYLQDQSPKMPNAAIRPAMLVVPGGGYQYCSDREGEPVALAYMAQGFNAFVLRYTADATTPIDKALQDGAAAMDYLRANAAELEIDPQQIAAVGFSAGGHLVASLGTLLPKAQRPNALVLGYAATLGAMWTVAGRQEPDLHALVDDDTPPTFLFATQGDALVPVKNSLVFADALADHSIPFALHLFPTGAHGISLATACTSGPEASRVNPATAQWLPMSVDFLQKLWGCLGVTAPDPELAAQLADVLFDQHAHGLAVVLNGSIQSAEVGNSAKENAADEHPQQNRQPAESCSLNCTGNRACTGNGRKLMAENGPAVGGNVILTVVILNSGGLCVRVNAPGFCHPAPIKRISTDKNHSSDQHDDECVHDNPSLR